MSVTTGSQGRAVAAAVTVLLAMALAAAVAGRGCSAEDETPEGVVRAFAAAARADDRDALYQMLSPSTRKRLEVAARRATELVGVGQRYTPRDLIRPDLDHSEPARVRLRSVDGDRAVVEILDVHDQPRAIELVEIDGHWRIDLPGYASDRRDLR